MTEEALTFACPKCASNKAYPVGYGMMRCRNCKHTAVYARWYLEKRPSLRWSEAIEQDPNEGEWE